MLPIDINAIRRRLKHFIVFNAMSWIATALLLIVPAVQWARLGSVPLDTTFFLLIALNIVSLGLTIFLTKRIKFFRYQLAYFLTHQGDQHGK